VEVEAAAFDLAATLLSIIPQRLFRGPRSGVKWCSCRRAGHFNTVMMLSRLNVQAWSIQ